jgi:uncharacterized protein YbjT (DUF2867 family)
MPSQDGGLTLVVGATGDLGGRVLRELLARNMRVRVLVREGEDVAARLSEQGADVAKGDLLDPDSLVRALDGVSGLVTTASGTADTFATVDGQGNRNLIDAAARAGVGRFVFTSVLGAEKGRNVPLFWQKKLAEDYLEASGVPYVVLRAGTLLGGRQDWFAKDLRKGRLSSLGNPDVDHSYIHIDDAARFLVASLGSEHAAGRRVDVGIERPVPLREFAAVVGRLLERPIKLRTVPWPPVSAVLRVAGMRSPKIRNFRAMFAFFLSGQYVADTTAQEELFGPPPTVDDSLRRYLESVGLTPVAPPSE